MPTRSNAPRRQLLRVLGAGFALAVVVGGTVGVGILRSPAIVAANTDGPGTAIAIWLIGGMYALLGAAAYAELGSSVARSGGVYVYVQTALGNGPAFLFGWADLLSSCTTIAFASVAFVEFGSLLVQPLASAPGPAAAALVAIFALSQLGGVRFSSIVQQSMTAVKALLFLGLIFGLLLFAPAAPATGVTPVVDLGGVSMIAGLVVALQLVIGAYDGWAGGSYFAGEDRAPQRNLPRAILGGVALVIVIYLLANIALLRALPFEQLAQSKLPAADAARAWLGERGALLITLISAVSVLPLLGCVLMVASRIAWAMASDGLLPAIFARVDARGTPAPALLAVASAGMLMIAGSGGVLNTLIGIGALLAITGYVGGFTALLVLRARNGVATGAFRMPGYPYTILLLLGVAMALTIAVIVSSPGDSALAVVVLAMAWPVYRLGRGGAAPAMATADEPGAP